MELALRRRVPAFGRPSFGILSPSLHIPRQKTDTQGVRSKPPDQALVGRRRNRLSLLAAMREREPRGQLAGRLLWGLAIEGHHRRWHPRLPRQLGTPPVADRRDLDLVRTPAYGFFEMMNDHGCGGLTVANGTSGWDRTLTIGQGAGDFTRSSRAIKRREARRRRPHTAIGRSSGDPAKEKRALSGSAQVIHMPSTGFPQRRLRPGCGSLAGVRHVECS